MDRRRKQKALAPVKVGSVSVVRYQTGDGRTKIVWRDVAGVRRAKLFADSKKAREHAETIARDINNGGVEAAIFSTADRASYAQAQRDVTAHGLPVHAATAEWAVMREKAAAAGRSLAELVEAGIRALSRPLHPVAVVVEEFLLSKEPRDLHGRYRRGLEQTLGKFAVAFPRDIASVTASQIEEYLAGLGKGTRRRDNILTEIRQLFRFAWRRKYLPEELTAAREVSLVHKLGASISFFTPEEVQLILEAVKPEWRETVAILAFSGARTEECCLSKDAAKSKDALRWEDFDWDDREINVRGETAKTGHPRRMPILDNLWEWTKHARDRGARGPVCMLGRPDRELGSDGRALRVINRERERESKTSHLPGLQPEQKPLVWHADGLRHSYGSYRMAVLRDIQKLASEMGNSPAIIKRHYHNPRPKSQAAAYFSIVPVIPQNVVQLHLSREFANGPELVRKSV